MRGEGSEEVLLPLTCVGACKHMPTQDHGVTGRGRVERKMSHLMSPAVSASPGTLFNHKVEQLKCILTLLIATVQNQNVNRPVLPF